MKNKMNDKYAPIQLNRCFRQFFSTLISDAIVSYQRDRQMFTSGVFFLQVKVVLDKSFDFQITFRYLK